MKYQLLLREKALNEIKDAYSWYEDQQEGLGESFLNAISDYARIILKNPNTFKTTYKKFKEVPLKKFPYIIVYFIDEKKKKIILFSVFHTSRNPKRKFKK